MAEIVEGCPPVEPEKGAGIACGVDIGDIEISGNVDISPDGPISVPICVDGVPGVLLGQCDDGVPTWKGWAVDGTFNAGVPPVFVFGPCPEEEPEPVSCPDTLPVSTCPDNPLEVVTPPDTPLEVTISTDCDADVLNVNVCNTDELPVPPVPPIIPPMQPCIAVDGIVDFYAFVIIIDGVQQIYNLDGPVEGATILDPCDPRCACGPCCDYSDTGPCNCSCPDDSELPGILDTIGGLLV